MSALHVYALLNEDDEPGDVGPGLAGAAARTVRAGGLAAVVSDVDEPPAVDLAALRAHDALVRRVALAARALLPMRFGQLVPDEATLGALVERSLPRLKTALAAVAGCEQITWRVFGGGEAVPAPPRHPGAAGGPGTRYLLERDARRRAEAAPPPALAPVLARVAPLVRDEWIEPHAAPPLVASVHHLVRARDRDAYRALVARTLEDVRGVRVQVGEPAPPYAFAGGRRP